MATYVHGNIVVVGSFNPAIFQPQWFRKHDLLPAAELDAAEKRNPDSTQSLWVSNDMTSIKFESLQLQVLNDRWQLLSDRRDWVPDLGTIALSVFGALPHTPVTTVGFNYSEHRSMEKNEYPAKAQTFVGGGRLKKFTETEDFELGGWVRYRRGNGARATIRVEPSTMVAGGIFVTVNHEWNPIAGVAKLNQILASEWLGAIEYSRHVVAEVLEEN